jgi:uncharacterized membrane protein
MANRRDRRRARAATGPLGKSALRAMGTLEDLQALDPLAGAVARAADRLLSTPLRRNLWRGTWLGHAFHPLLSDFVEGPWMAATFLDLFGPPGSEAAARRLLGLGCLVAVPAYVAGLSDFLQAPQRQRRAGIVHLGAVTAAGTLYVVSYVCRRKPGSRAATRLGLVAGLVALADGYVGGHLSHVRGVAVGEQIPGSDRDRKRSRRAARKGDPQGSPFLRCPRLRCGRIRIGQMLRPTPRLRHLRGRGVPRRRR